MSVNTAKVEAHSLWFRERRTDDAYTLLDCAESGMAEIPELEKATSTTFGRSCDGEFVSVVTSIDPPGDLPASQIDFYELWSQIHPLIKANRSNLPLFIQRLRYATPNNMSVRELAKQLDLFEITFTGGTRGAGPNLTGEGGAVQSNVTYDIELSSIIQLDLGLTRITQTETENFLSALVMKRNIDRSSGYRGPDRVMYLGADTEGTPTTPGALWVSQDRGSTFAELTNAPFAGNAGVQALAWQPISETQFRLVCGQGTLAAAKPNLAYYDFNFGDEASASVTPTRFEITGATAADAVADILWPEYGRMYVAVGSAIFISTTAGVSIPATAASSPGQTVNQLKQDWAKNVWAVGNSGVILVEYEGDRGTFTAAVPPTGGANITAIDIAKDGTIYAGVGNSIRRSRDGARQAANWSSLLTLGTNEVVRDMYCVEGSAEVVMAFVSDTSSPAGRVLRSIDGGLTWVPFTTTTNSGYNRAITTSDPNKFFIVGPVDTSTGLVEKLA